MGEEWEQTLCALGLASSISNPVQRYGENLIRARNFQKKRFSKRRTELKEFENIFIESRLVDSRFQGVSAKIPILIMYLNIHLTPPPIYKEPPAGNARQSTIDFSTF